MISLHLPFWEVGREKQPVDSAPASIIVRDGSYQPGQHRQDRVSVVEARLSCRLEFQPSPFRDPMTESNKFSKRRHVAMGSRRGRALATVLLAATAGIVCIYLIAQSQFDTPTSDSDPTLAQLDTPSTETYGAASTSSADASDQPQSVATAKPSVDGATSDVPTEQAEAPQFSPEVAARELKPAKGANAPAGPAGPELNSPEINPGDGPSVLTAESREALILSRPPIIEDPFALRDWTASNGARAEAAFVKLDAGQAVLRDATGRDYRIPLTRLSAADREFIEAITK